MRRGLTSGGSSGTRAVRDSATGSLMKLETSEMPETSVVAAPEADDGASPACSLTVLDNVRHSDEETPYRLHRRFDRLGRLYGDGAVERLMGARVVVFGLGG